jgi:putative peptidoglycan lipid II flippase
MGMAVGAVAGSLGHLLIQIPGLRQKGARYRPLLTLRHAGVQQVLKLMAPRVLGLSFGEINKFVTLYLSGLMMQGSLPALNLAWRIMIMPQGILGQAMGTAAFPTLASLSARGAFDEMRQILSDSLRTLLFLGTPATLLLMILRRPVIVVLFERGVFTSEGTQLVIWALLLYAIGLVPLTSLEVVARAFYALNDTLTPVLAGGLQIALMAGLSFWFSQSLFPLYGLLPLGGLALGYSLSSFLEVGVLLWLLRGRLGGINGRVLLDGAWRIGVAGGGMGTAVSFSLRPISDPLLQLIVGGVVGGVVYLGLCWLLRLPEIDWVWQLVRPWLARLLRRRRTGE